MQQQTFPLQTWHGVRVAVWLGKKFIFIDNDSRELPRMSKRLYADFVVIEENAVATLQPVLERFDFDTLVIGSSNKMGLSQQLQQEATQRRISNHALLQQGTLTIAW